MPETQTAPLSSAPLALEDSFKRLLGRQPSDAEKQKLFQVRDALGLKNNDALWLVFMALQHYQRLYEQFPERIEKSAQTTLATFKTTADAVVKASAESAKADLAKAVEKTATDIARHVAATEKSRWIATCAFVCTACLLAVGFFAYRSGEESGRNNGWALGYTQAQDQKAADAWANTAEGQLAYRFALSGELARLARCEGKGWRVTKGVCYPQPAADRLTYGWKMP